jgi:hypothetical protein
MLKRLAFLSLLLLQATGCYMTPRAAAGLTQAVLLTAVVAADVALLASHDAHVHYYGCGHEHRWRSGHEVYYYQSRWEYYDGGHWYYYAD